MPNLAVFSLCSALGAGSRGPIAADYECADCRYSADMHRLDSVDQA